LRNNALLIRNNTSKKTPILAYYSELKSCQDLAKP
jgi:hypothetical protein